MNTYRTIASFLPPKVREVVYALLGAANFIVVSLIAMEIITDVQPYAIALVVANGLGFTMAAGNVNKNPAPVPAPNAAAPVGDDPAGAVTPVDDGELGR